jgi:hypothetical protein
MITIIGPLNTGLAVGANGVATANADTPIVVSGYLSAVYIKYNGAGLPATTDAIIKTKGTNCPSYTMLTVSDAVVSGLFRPRVLPDNLLGVDLAALTIAEMFPVCDYVNIKIDQANAGDNLDVWLLVEERL